jgi:hypothetical protein
VDLEETEARNDFVGEGQQQFNLLIFTENTKYNLATVKLTTIYVTKLLLYKIIKVVMICFAKRGLTEGLYILREGVFGNMLI